MWLMCVERRIEESVCWQYHQMKKFPSSERKHTARLQAKQTGDHRNDRRNAGRNDGCNNRLTMDLCKLNCSR